MVRHPLETGVDLVRRVAVMDGSFGHAAGGVGGRIGGEDESHDAEHDEHAGSGDSCRSADRLAVRHGHRGRGVRTEQGETDQRQDRQHVPVEESAGPWRSRSCTRR